MSCEETLHALRMANQALEQLPDLAPRRQRKRTGGQEDAGNGAGPSAVQQQNDERQQHPPMGKIPLDPTPATAKSGDPATDGHAGQDGGARSAPSSSGKGAEQPGKVRLESTSPKGLAALQGQFEDVANGRGGSTEPAGSMDGSMDAPGGSRGEALAAVQRGVGSAVAQAREVIAAGRTAVEERKHNGAASSPPYASARG